MPANSTATVLLPAPSVTSVILILKDLSSFQKLETAIFHSAVVGSKRGREKERRCNKI